MSAEFNSINHKRADEFLDKLLRLKERDRIAYLTLPADVREIVERYEREQQSSREKGRPN